MKEQVVQLTKKKEKSFAGVVGYSLSVVGPMQQVKTEDSRMRNVIVGGGNRYFRGTSGSTCEVYGERGSTYNLLKLDVEDLYDVPEEDSTNLIAMLSRDL